MEKQKVPIDKPRRNDERERRTSPYQQLASDIAGPLAEIRFPGINNQRTTQHDPRNSVDGGAEVAVGDRTQPAPEQAPQRNQREKRVPPYQQLAADIAQPLAELQVSVGNGEETRQQQDRTSVDGRTENALGDGQETREKEPPKNQRERNIPPYLQLAADIAQPLAELQAPGASNSNGDAKSSVDGKTESENESHQVSRKGSKQEVSTERKWKQKHYLNIAEDISGQLAELRVPGTNEDRDFEGAAMMQSQHEVTESFSYQQSLSEYEPDASCCSGYGHHSYGRTSMLMISSEEMQSEPDHGQTLASYSNQKDITDSVPHQESLSEYNPDATCGSYGHESCGRSSSHDEVEMGTEQDYTEKWASRGYVEVVNSFPQQESLSEYNPDATCCSGSNDDPSSHLSLQFERRSKVDAETVLHNREDRNAQLDNCYTQPGGEPASKRSKLNPEVTDEQELSRSIRGSVSGMSSVESTHFESTGRAASNEFVLENGAAHSRTRDDECLSYEFEQMNIEETSSTDMDEKVRSRDTSEAKVYPQGARPKTNQKPPKQKKHKMPKENTKNAYTELAKDVAGDLATMNAQLRDTKRRDLRDATEPGAVRCQDLCDSSIVKSEQENNSSLYSFPTELGRPDIEREPRVNEVGVEQSKTEAARYEMDDTSMIDSLQPTSLNSPATSRDADTSSRRARITRDAEEHRRAQIEEQQRLADSMGPELQAMVIEMMRQDEEELGGGHVLYGVNLNPPVSPRLQYQQHREDNSPGASAQETSEQPVRKRSGKGKKKKGHYVELAGIIAPELAEVNKVLMNGHEEGSARSAENGRKGKAAVVADRGARGYSSSQERVSRRGNNSVITNGTRGSDDDSRDQLLKNGVSSREQTSLPQKAANRRQRCGNENRKPGASAYATGKGPGKENRGQARKQKKSKEDENKSSCSLMAESMVASLQNLNMQLEEQQRQKQRASKNGASGDVSEEKSEDSVTRDTGSIVSDDCASSRKLSKNGYK